MTITLDDVGKLIDDLKPDPWGWGGTLVKTTATHAVIVLPMLVNDRIVLMPLDCTTTYDYGWCYDRGTNAALMAALLWEPDAEAEPLSYKKAACGNRVLP